MARQKKAGGVFVAIESFHAADPDNPDGSVHVRADHTRVRAGHWLLKKYPQFFDEIDEHIDYDTEQATAAPGERRAVSLRTGGE